MTESLGAGAWPGAHITLTPSLLFSSHLQPPGRGGEVGAPHGFAFPQAQMGETQEGEHCPGVSGGLTAGLGISAD